MSSDNTATGSSEQPSEGPTRPVIRDRRRIDPETGAVRAPSGGTGPAPTTATQPDLETTMAQADEEAPDTAVTTGGRPDGEADVASYSTSVDDPVEEVHPDTQLATDRLEDLRRLQAEYINYKKRVDRDRAKEREVTIGGVVEALLPVLDDIYLAREHGELSEGPFAAIADKLEATLGRFGVERFGVQGEAFDPVHHEALMHIEADLPPGTERTTIVQVMQPGYRVGERVVRAARVAVADPV